MEKQKLSPKDKITVSFYISLLIIIALFFIQATTIVQVLANDPGAFIFTRVPDYQQTTINNTTSLIAIIIILFLSFSLFTSRR